MSTVREDFDALLLDLDGTVYQGTEAVPGAVDALLRGGLRLLYVTNNASRAAHDVGEQLRQLGLPAEDADVVTSSQSAARLLTELLPNGGSVLVVGTEALSDEIARVGFSLAADAAAAPDAVVHGHSPETGWRQLAEATVAIRAGAVWVATNTDPTLPSERGLLPGNGSMVTVVRTATGQEPVVAGKPATPIMRDAVERARARCPLVVGDRLDTDIAGARAAGLPSMLVLTGVSTVGDLLRAGPAERPDLVAQSLGALDSPAEALTAAWKVAGWEVHRTGEELVLTSTSVGPGERLDGVRALCAVAWAGPRFTTVRGADAPAREYLAAWGLR